MVLSLILERLRSGAAERGSDALDQVLEGLIGRCTLRRSGRSRRHCRADRPCGSNVSLGNPSAMAFANSVPITRAPMVMIWALLESAARSAEYVSWVSAARMPGTLLAEMQTPMPVPQTRMVRSYLPSVISIATSHGEMSVSGKALRCLYFRLAAQSRPARALSPRPTDGLFFLWTIQCCAFPQPDLS